MSEHQPALDPDIVAALAAQQEGAAGVADGALLARVRTKLMQAIAAEGSQGHLTVDAEGGHWRNFLPGIDRKVLHEHEGVMSYLLRFAPGAVLPAHHHPIDEECVVLEGTLHIGELLLGAGAFHLARRGLPHGNITSDEGAVIYLRGASPKAEHLA